MERFSIYNERWMHYKINNYCYNTKLHKMNHRPFALVHRYQASRPSCKRRFFLKRRKHRHLGNDVSLSNNLELRHVRFSNYISYNDITRFRIPFLCYALVFDWILNKDGVASLTQDENSRIDLIISCLFRKVKNTYKYMHMFYSFKTLVNQVKQLQVRYSASK